MCDILQQSTAGMQENNEVPVFQNAPQNVVTVEEPAEVVRKYFTF